MGIIQHHAVIATTDNTRAFKRMWKLCKEKNRGEKGLPVYRPGFVKGPRAINRYRSIVLMPDGSKEGNPASRAGNAMRAWFIEQLRASEGPWSWVEVECGERGTWLGAGAHSVPLPPLKRRKPGPWGWVDVEHGARGISAEALERHRQELHTICLADLSDTQNAALDGVLKLLDSWSEAR